ncbi:MAG TPA: MFS transporter [Acidimicrobiales bacterium]|nr:MFS transporter [Acidimicrobiales bacterium]
MAAVFFVNGALFANWVTRVPAVKDAVDTGTGPLGVALLGIGAGSLLSMPFSGRLCERYGSGRIVTASGLGMSAVLLLPAFAPDVVTLGLCLLFYGAGFGLLDVSMNVQAVAVVKRLERPIMPWFHAAFSCGGLAGAATGGLAAQADLGPAPHFALVGSVMAVVVLWADRHLLPDPDPVPEPAPKPEPEPDPTLQGRDGDGDRDRRTRRLNPYVIGVGAVAACAALGEGVMADWSTLFLRDVRDVDAGPAAAGFAAFSVAMTAGRLGGEAAIRRLGATRVLQVGGSTAAAGVVLAVTVPSPVAAVVGFLLVGLGLSCGFPLAISAAGESGSGSGSNEIATASMIGYLGFLLGPPLIGLLAEVVGLGPALLAIAVSSAGLVALAPILGTADPAATGPDPVRAGAR